MVRLVTSRSVSFQQFFFFFFSFLVFFELTCLFRQAQL
jgi:hypothetical protein